MQQQLCLSRAPLAMSSSSSTSASTWPSWPKSTRGTSLLDVLLFKDGSITIEEDGIKTKTKSKSHDSSPSSSSPSPPLLAGGRRRRRQQEEVTAAIARYELELGIPATDALSRPVGRLVDMVLGAFPELDRSLATKAS